MLTEKGEHRLLTTVNCCLHLAHSSKLPIGGFGPPLPPVDHIFFARAVYSSSDVPSYSPSSFAFFLALFLAAPVDFPPEVRPFLTGDCSSGSSS